MRGSQLGRTVIALLCSACLLSAGDNERSRNVLRMKASEVMPRVGERLAKSGKVEVALRTGEIIVCAGVRIHPASLELFADRAKKTSVRVVDFSAVRELHYMRRSRSDVIRGGLLGGLGGLLLGAFLAINLADRGHDGGAAVVLVAAPAAGAYAGAKLSGKDDWERVVILDEGASASSSDITISVLPAR